MNAAQLRYVAFNSIMCHCSWGAIPEESQKQLESDLSDSELSELKSGLETLAKMKGRELTDIEKMLVNYFRSPTCALVMSANNSSPLPIEMLAKWVREGQITVNDARSWVIGSITDVEVGNVYHPKLADSVLSLPEEYAGSEGISRVVGEIFEAFKFVCWGVFDPSEEQKQLVNELIGLCSPAGDVSCGKQFVPSFVRKCLKAGYSPTWASAGPVLCSDISQAIGTLSVPAWWFDAYHEKVSLMLPRGNADKLAHAQLPVSEFVKLAETGDLPELYVAGNTIKLRETAG